MKKAINRREMLGLSSAGIVTAAAALLMPNSLAFAAEAEARAMTADPEYILLNTTDYLKTGDSLIDANNRKAFELWKNALIEARANGEEVVTIVNPANVPSVSTRAAKVATTNEKSFTSGGLISIHYKLALMYDVGANNQVSGFRNHNALLTYGFQNPTLSIVGYSYTILDGGRTYAVNTTLHATCTAVGVLSGATFQTYSEYYYTGNATLF